MRRIFSCLVICLGFSVPVYSDDLEGVNDPILKGAINAWLDGENLEPLYAISDLAYVGNFAARLLLHGIQSEGFVSGFGALSGPEKNKLLFDAPKDEPGENWLSVEAQQNNSVAVSMLAISDTSIPFEDWADHARVLLGVGEREKVLRAARNRLVLFRMIEPSLIEFLDEVVSFEHPLQFSLWLAKHSQSNSYNSDGNVFAEESERVKSAWPYDPWTEGDEIRLNKAYAMGRLYALFFKSYRSLISEGYGHQPPFPFSKLERSARLALMPNLVAPAESQANARDYRAAADVMINEARRGFYVRPILSVCESKCAHAVHDCMYIGFQMLRGSEGANRFYTPMERLIPQERWVASKRAELEAVGLAKTRAKEAEVKDMMKWLETLPLDQCFLEFSNAQ